MPQSQNARRSPSSNRAPVSAEKSTATPVVRRPIRELRPYAGNARTHSKKQIRQIAASIERFGFTNPVLVSDEGEIIAGHGRVMAAQQLGMTEVPTLTLSHLSAAERRLGHRHPFH
jgi:ParB-like chromosome segregation protein Spo0J